MANGLMNLNDSMVEAAYARYMQLKQSGMQDPQIYQLMDQEKTMVPLGQLAAKYNQLKAAAQQTPMPPQNTINEQIDQQLQAMQNPQQQGIGALPEAQQGQAPQGAPPQPGQVPQAPQGAPPQQGAPQPMPPQGMAAGGLASIPVHNVGDSNTYASGGIVAFNDGGDVKHFDGLSGSTVSASKFSSDPAAAGFTFSTRVDAPARDPDREEYARLKDLFNLDVITLASRNIPSGASSYSSEIEKIQQLRKDPTIRQRYEQLKTKIANEDAAAKQAAQTAANRETAGRYGITALDTPPTTTPPPEDKPTNKPTNNTTLTPSSSAAGAASTYKDPVFETFTPELVDTKKLLNEDFDETASMNEYRNKKEAYEKEHGIGAAEEELISYLKDEKGEADKDLRYNRGMALAKFGFTLASTPGSFVQALAKSGVGYAEEMMDINAKARAAQRQNTLALLQAKAAKEKGDMETFNESMQYAAKAKAEARQHTMDMANLVHMNNVDQLAVTSERNQRAASSASLALQRDSLNATIQSRKETAAATKEYRDATINAGIQKAIGAAIRADTTIQTLDGQIAKEDNPDKRAELQKQRAERASVISSDYMKSGGTGYLGGTAEFFGGTPDDDYEGGG